MYIQNIVSNDTENDDSKSQNGDEACKKEPENVEGLETGKELDFQFHEKIV